MSFTTSGRDSLHHEVQLQETIPANEIIDSLASTSEQNNYHAPNDSIEIDPEENTADQPTLEQIQRVYYARGLEELESLQLIDVSPLANWKLSSYKQGYGLAQLREDSPDSLWQSDGSNGNNNVNVSTSGVNNQLSNPHSVTIQFSKKVSLERISVFTNFSLDESYTPSKLKIMAGSSSWDLSEVCTVNFNKPIGWLHIIFNGIRNDGVLKCFMVKLVILANHQDGKDSHIRAIKCFGKKTAKSSITASVMAAKNKNSFLSELDTSLLSASGVLLNNYEIDSSLDHDTSKVLGNVAEVIGFNGFQSLELQSISSIR